MAFNSTRAEYVGGMYPPGANRTPPKQGSRAKRSEHLDGSSLSLEEAALDLEGQLSIPGVVDRLGIAEGAFLVLAFAWRTEIEKVPLRVDSPLQAR
jgi:hypothetical protein